MGAACQQCMNIFTHPKKQPQLPRREQEQLETTRRLAQMCKQKDDKNESLGHKGSHLEIQSNFSAVRDTKIFFKTKSTALFSSDGDRRHSSILQFTLDHQSIIIRGSDNEIPNPSTQQYYTLISKVAFVKKTMDCIKVTSPDGQSQLHCPPQFLFTTLTVSQGRPAENIEEVAPNKLIQVNDSRIQVSLKMKCKNCKKLLKITCCKGIINIAIVECPACEGKEWKIVEMDANAPIWGDGMKLQPHEVVDPAPSILRIMGCVICLKFSNCEKMSCGCLLCTPCLAANGELSLDMQCRMCRGSYIL